MDARALWDVSTALSVDGHTYTTLRHIQHGCAVELWHESLGAFHVFALEDTPLGKVGAVYCCFSSGMVDPARGSSPPCLNILGGAWPRAHPDVHAGTCAQVSTLTLPGALTRGLTSRLTQKTRSAPQRPCSTLRITAPLRLPTSWCSPPTIFRVRLIELFR